LELPANRPTGPDASAIPTDGWEVLTRTRGANRPSGLEWAAWLTDGWVELRGPDAGIRAGLATIDGRRVVVIATDRHLIGDAAARPGPDAFRLAQRAVALADQLGLPVLSLVDTPGAEPGPSAEADGIAGEIARTLLAMAGAKGPTVALCVGEGGSGGAMALAHADRFLLLSGAVFSVIGPEAGAAIIYRDAARAPELARNFRMTAPELLALKVVDEVVDETGPDAIARVRAAVARALATATVGQRDERPDRLTHANLANGANG
jgi:acetyl-CoA carboxylase carboxyl transferase subunit beta